jgi:hypothetical protein
MVEGCFSPIVDAIEEGVEVGEGGKGFHCFDDVIGENSIRENLRDSP